MSDPLCNSGDRHIFEDCTCGDEGCHRVFCVMCEYVREGDTK